MPRFFLHIRDAAGLSADEEGVKFPNLSKVHMAAVAGARSLICEEITAGRLDLRGRIEVTDEEGKCIMTINFHDVVEVVDGELPSQSQQEAR